MIVVDVEADGIRFPISKRTVEQLVNHVLSYEEVNAAIVSISFISPEHIAKINEEHLGHEGPTDVITFPLGEDGSGALITDIYICPDVARRQAKDWGVGIREEVSRLVVHGILHSCGWIHPESNDREESEMWKRQEEILSDWLEKQDSQ